MPELTKDNSLPENLSINLRGEKKRGDQKVSDFLLAFSFRRFTLSCCLLSCFFVFKDLNEYWVVRRIATLQMQSENLHTKKRNGFLMTVF